MSASTTVSLSQRFLRLFATEWGTILFTGISLLFFIGAFGLRGQAGYFPMGVSLCTLVFGLAILGMSLWEGSQDTPPSEGAVELGWSRRTLLTVGWFAFALAVTYAFGIVIGASVASMMYFLLLTSVGRIYAIVNGVAFSLFIWVVFKQLAGLPLYGGIF